MFDFKKQRNILFRIFARNKFSGSRARVILLIPVSLLIASMLLGACGSDVKPTEVSAGPHTWLINDIPGLLKQLPPAGTVFLPPPSPEPDQLKGWDHPADRWLDLELDLIKNQQSSPIRASRGLALLMAGFNDGLIVENLARQQGLAVSENAFLAGIAEPIIIYCHPVLSNFAENQTKLATWVDVWQGRSQPADVEAGFRLGKAVSDKIIAYAREDGADQGRTYLPLDLIGSPAEIMQGQAKLKPVAPGKWQPTAPDFDLGLQPDWGKVKLIGVKVDTNFNLAPPPAWDSPEFDHERELFRQSQLNLSPEDRQLAVYWAGGAGTVTPAGLWFQKAESLARRDNFNLVRTVEMYSLLAVTMHNALCVDWSFKYQYMEARPIQWMSTVDKNWQPVVKTPAFPSYPSGHATVSPAAAIVLSGFFPGDTQQLQQSAQEAAHSRLVGGIHWDIDNKRGFELGTVIGNEMLKQNSPLTNASAGVIRK